jgi:hypothetical protein
MAEEAIGVAEAGKAETEAGAETETEVLDGGAGDDADTAARAQTGDEAGERAGDEHTEATGDGAGEEHVETAPETEAETTAEAKGEIEEAGEID